MRLTVQNLAALLPFVLVTACGGSDGANGKNGLVETTVVASGAECATGGISIASGIDGSGDGALQPAEIASTKLVCNGATANGQDGAVALVSTRPAAPDSTCVLGGTTIVSGLDTDKDGVLGETEITYTEVLCSTVASSFDGLVFGARTHFAGSLELFAVGKDGKALRKVSATQDSTQSISSYAVSPDHKWVAYVGKQNSGYASELLVASLLDNRPLIAASGPIPASALGITAMAWSPDSSRIAFRGSYVIGDPDDLYTVLPDGTGRVKVSKNAVGIGASINSFQWAPNSSRLAFVADFDTAGVKELYTVRLDGAELSRVSVAKLAVGVVSAVKWSPDSSRLAFLSNSSGPTTVHSVTPTDTTGTTLKTLNGALVAGGNVTGFVWSPDSQHIAHRADASTLNTFYLYRTAPDGTGWTSLGGGLPTNLSVVASSFSWAPDNSRIAFLAQIGTGAQEMYTVKPDGSMPIKLNPDLVANGSVVYYAWAPNSTRLSVLADGITDNVFEYFIAQPGAAGWTKLSRDPIAGGQVGLTMSIVMSAWMGAGWSPDSARVAYLADGDTVGMLELYVATVGGNPAPYKLNGTLVANGDVSGLGWSPDSARLAYVADASVNGANELFVGVSSGNPAPTVVSSPQLGAGVSNFVW